MAEVLVRNNKPNTGYDASVPEVVTGEDSADGTKRSMHVAAPDGIQLAGEATDQITATYAIIETYLAIKNMEHEQKSFQQKMLKYMEIITGVAL